MLVSLINAPAGAQSWRLRKRGDPSSAQDAPIGSPITADYPSGTYLIADIFGERGAGLAQLDFPDARISDPNGNYVIDAIKRTLTGAGMLAGLGGMGLVIIIALVIIALALKGK